MSTKLVILQFDCDEDGETDTQECLHIADILNDIVHIHGDLNICYNLTLLTPGQQRVVFQELEEPFRAVRSAERARS